MLEADPEGGCADSPGWQPTLPDADRDGAFTVNDLVVFTTSSSA